MNASYSASNLMSPSGYSETPIDPMHYEVRAGGTESTTRERVEKIALARAAEIGVEQRLKYFRVANVTHSVVCGKKGRTKDSEVPAIHRPAVALDVYYAKQPGPEFRPSEETFAQVKAELDADATPPEAREAAKAAVRAQCGAG
jgi:hypothetical protein